MKKGDNVLVTYDLIHKSIVGTFLEDTQDTYLFRNKNGLFAVTKKKVTCGDIAIEIIEDYD